MVSGQALRDVGALGIVMDSGCVARVQCDTEVIEMISLESEFAVAFCRSWS